MKMMTKSELMSKYLNDFNPIPLNGVPADPDSLERWAEQTFEWLNVGDPLAEDAVRALRHAGISLARPAAALQQLADGGDAACHGLLKDMHDTPEWVDYDLMRRGGAMAQRHFPMLILSLIYGGLPLTFAHPDAAEVFGSTGRMQSNIGRRLNESATLFFGIYNSDELAPGGPIWETCLHVRLIHAVIRMNLLDKGWDVGLRGVPINPLVTASGPAFFGTHQLDGLRRLGAHISADEALGFSMIWRYVTRLLGVPQQLIGRTQDEQDAFDHHFANVFFAPNDHSRAVMKDLIDGLATLPPTNRVPPTLQLALFRCMLGDDMADAYAIERSRKGERQLKLMLPALNTYSWIQRAPLLKSLLRFSGERTLARLGTDGIVKLDTVGNRH